MVSDMIVMALYKLDGTEVYWFRRDAAVGLDDIIHDDKLADVRAKVLALPGEVWALTDTDDGWLWTGRTWIALKLDMDDDGQPITW